jgi:hypothetical protein
MRSREMARTADLWQAAKKAGGTVEGGLNGRWYSYNVEAPAGQVWGASSTHALRVEWRVGEDDYREESITDALERMEEGLAECDEPECDYCHPEGS